MTEHFRGSHGNRAERDAHRAGDSVKHGVSCRCVVLGLFALLHYVDTFHVSSLQLSGFLQMLSTPFAFRTHDRVFIHFGTAKRRNLSANRLAIPAG
jgi:hypothetical protein